jgi:SNF2 family DNA or RNA helicase
MIKASLNYWRRRYILTGSPSPNGIQDLWAQMYILDGGMALEPFITHFRNKYFYKLPNGGEWDLLPFPGAEEKIAAKIDHLVLRLKAEDYLELPELVYNPIKVDIPLSVWKLYRELENEFYLKLEEGEVTVANMAVLGNKLRQLVSGAMYVENGTQHIHEAKLDAMADLIDELSGQPVLVGYDFVFEAELVKKKFPQAVFLDGKHDEQIVEAFNQGRVPILAGNTSSLAHGLNLQKSCCHVAYLTLTWNLEDFEQFIRRVVRQGNTAARVMCHIILARGTVDEAVWKTIQAKDFSQKSLLSHLRSSIMGSVGAVPHNTEFLT